MELTPLVLSDGDQACACGRVVTAGDEVWFDPPLPVPLVYYEPGHEPAPRPSGLGIRVDGVDLTRLAQHREKDGAIEGWTCLAGVWHDNRLSVTQQGGRDPHRRKRPERNWTLPPCEPPVGGWPSGGEDENIDIEEELYGPEVVTVTMFRPSRRQVVCVIASGDPDLTRRRLRGVLGDRLCVVKSRWARAQVREVRAQLHEHHQEWLLYGWGESADADGQLQLTAEMVRVTTGLAEFAATLPEGLFAADPWLTPVADEIHRR